MQTNLNSFISNKHKIKESYYLTNELGELLSKKIRIGMADADNLDSKKISLYA